MCESEFLLVKQAAAERLGVSPDRLRIKYEQHSLNADFKNFHLFYCVGIIVDTERIGISTGYPSLEIDDLISFYSSSIFGNGFFFSKIACTSLAYISGYSFEVV